jgi:DNA polymerase III subunit epsilon
MQFAAIDFETASNHPNSACQVGVVVVENGTIVREYDQYICPPRSYFSPNCVAVHGIRFEDVASAPPWQDVWREIEPMLIENVVLAHNAPFDMRVLLSSILGTENIAPRIEFQCTRLIAMRAWPGRSGYGLQPTAESLGIVFQHHNALADAKACAKVALAAADSVEANSITDLEGKLFLKRGMVEYARSISPSTINRKKSILRKMSDVGEEAAEGNTPFLGSTYHPGRGNHLSMLRETSASYVRNGRSKKEKIKPEVCAKVLLELASSSPPLTGKHVSLQGELVGLDRPGSIRFLEGLGAIVHPTREYALDYVVVGIELDFPKVETSSEEDSSILKQVGGRILTQRQLIALIPGGIEAMKAML